VTRRSLVVAIAIALAACGGDDHAAIDAGSDASGDAPTALGTWDAPIVIAALPYTATGDTAAATEVRAEGYDCARRSTSAAPRWSTASTSRRRRS
jgi:hypothetical protein